MAISDYEMRRRQDFMRNFRSTEDLKRWHASQPQGKIMSARFTGKCADCGGTVRGADNYSEPDTIRYDGKAHHYPECPSNDCSRCGLDLSTVEEHTKADCDAWQAAHGQGETPNEEYFDRIQAERDREDQRCADEHSVAQETLTPFQLKQQRGEPICYNTLATTIVPASAPRKNVPDGRYTVVLPSGEWRTFRVRTQKEDASFAPGKTVVKYLAKSDNDDENSYVGFGFMVNGEIIPWKRFKGSAIVEAARVLEDHDALKAAGEAYALASGNCYMCGKTLTVPSSIAAGVGPDCAKRLMGF